jgi:hypothetical protein
LVLSRKTCNLRMGCKRVARDFNLQNPSARTKEPRAVTSSCSSAKIPQTYMRHSYQAENTSVSRVSWNL